MILTEPQILAYVKKPKNEAIIRRARELFATHRLHLKGIGLDEFLGRIEGYENAVQHDLRKKLAKTATVPVFAKETDNFSKIFTAQGFSRYYQFSSATQERLEPDFREYLRSVGEGMSMTQWMRDIWADKIHYESSGLLMVELPREANGTMAEPYLTCRSVLDLHDIEISGNKIEYVIFYRNIYDEEKKVTYKEYRVIDDFADYIVQERSGECKIIPEFTIPNPWKYVPAMMVSNQRDSRSKAHTTYIWKAIDIADEYLLDASIHTISKKLHGFPMRWARQRGCRKCQAKGIVNTGTFMDDNVTPRTLKCVDCDGTGIASKTEVSEVILIPQLEGRDDVDNVPVAGYVQPDIESLENQNVESDRLAKIIHMGIWADPERFIGDKSETATGRMLDVQSIHAKLLLVSENAEEVEKFLTNAIGQIRYAGDYKGAIINYGKKYFIRSADEIEMMYQTAKKSGMATHILDAYIEELIYLKFGNDPVELQRQLMLNTLEPFIHLSPKEVKELEVSEQDYLMKVYFTDYIERYEQEVKPIVMSTQEEIRIKLNEYNMEKMTEMELASTDESADRLGKIPLALQQLALAQERAIGNGNQQLANKIAGKMTLLTERLAK